MSGHLWQCDATELARLIRLGRASAREATQACLDRLHAVNPAINAVVQLMDAEALAAAEAADAAQARGEALGPLHGVPVTIKVNVDQKGHATTNGVVAFKDMVATEDSPVVANLRAAGAIIIGRTNTPAFSMRLMTDNALHGRTLNPRDPAITPGGSSGGAGAAVATGIGPIAHGNDIGGSVRIPAYCCGVVGLRTGYGRIGGYSTQAVVARPLGSQLMATQGPLARSVRDLRLALAAMAKDGGRDTRWADVPLVGPAPPRPIRVALVPEVPGGFTHPAQAEAVRQAGRHLAAAGYAVEEVLPPGIEQAIELWHAFGATELFAALMPQMEALGDDAGRAARATAARRAGPCGAVPRGSLPGCRRGDRGGGGRGGADRSGDDGMMPGGGPQRRCRAAASGVSFVKSPKRMDGWLRAYCGAKVAVSRSTSAACQAQRGL